MSPTRLAADPLAAIGARTPLDGAGWSAPERVHGSSRPANRLCRTSSAPLSEGASDQDQFQACLDRSSQSQLAPGHVVPLLEGDLDEMID